MEPPMPNLIYSTRKDAITNNQQFYIGKPCVDCSSTIRFSKNCKCAAKGCVVKKWKSYKQQWNKLNNDGLLAYRKKWKKEHPDKMKSYRKKWNEKNPEMAKICVENWQRNNPERYAANTRVSASRRRAFLRNAEGTHTLDEWLALKNSYGNICLCCKISEEELHQLTKMRLTEDHIIPLHDGGSNWITNIQPLCKSCNVKNYKHRQKYGEQIDYRLKTP